MENTEVQDKKLWTAAKAAAVGVGLLFGGPVTYAVIGGTLAYKLFSNNEKK